MTVKSVGYTGWKIVGVVSDKAAQFSTVKNIIFLIALVLSFMLILAIINSYISREGDNPDRTFGGTVEQNCRRRSGDDDRGAGRI